MKVLGQIAEILNKEVNGKYPFGAAIQNKTESVAGTPVVRELYNDPLMNWYHLLEITKVNPTNQEDNDDNGYQLIDAVKKLAGDYDKLINLSLISGTFTANVDFSILPAGFFCFAISTDNYQPTQIKGSNNIPVNFTSSGFSANEIILLKFEATQVVAYSFLNKTVSDYIYTNFGNPLHFNYSNSMEYEFDGIVLKNDLSKISIQDEIRTHLSDNTLIVNDIFKIQQGYIFSVYKPGTVTFLKFYLKPNTGSLAELVPQSAVNNPTNSNLPLILFDGNYIYMSNGSGSQTEDFVTDKYFVNLSTNRLSWSSRFNVDTDFVKTKNTVVKGTDFYQLINGELNRYDLTNELKYLKFSLPNINGRLFSFNGNVYLSTGEIARKLL